MFHFSKEITDYFMKFLSGGIHVEELEQWIYDKNFLSELGNNTYEFFISLDFHSLCTEKDLTQYILSLYEEKSIDVQRERINWIVSGMVDGSYDLILGCAELSQLRSFDKRYEYIPILFVGYDSVVEDINHRYNHLIEEEKREMERLINLYKREIDNLSKDFFKVRMPQSFSSILNQNIGYSVINESFTSWDDYERFEGKKTFRIYSTSRFLDYISNAAFASQEYPGPYLHYGIVDHIVNVVTISEPKVREIHRQ